MPLSAARAKLVHQALRSARVEVVAALAETWLVPLLRSVEDDPGMTFVEVAKEDEAVGIAMGAHLAGVRAAALMQNHGLFSALNGIVSGALLYRIPLLLVVSDRGHFGERDPWQTEGGRHTRRVLDAIGIVWDELRYPDEVERRVVDAVTLAGSSLSPVALLLPRALLWDDPT